MTTTTPRWRYLILISEPPRLETEWRLPEGTAEHWRVSIRKHLAGVPPRTFHELAASLFNGSASSAFGSPFEDGLWQAFEAGEIERTTELPVRFRARMT